MSVFCIISMISDKSFLGKLFVLLMLSVSLAAACESYYTAYSTSLTGVRQDYAVTTNFRQCYCVKNIQTYSFNIACAGTVKFFSTTGMMQRNWEKRVSSF
ncbi:hypothetical protein BC940DRAFT_294385 [Gongronella butleri]|nr:hypothetical protein BC940DRAFT_294385 [Gongronella butleri]